MARFFGSLANPFLPTVRTVRQYSPSKLRKDLIAGLTVSVVEVPQAMAYALVAGVPPQYGLYTSIIQGFIGALLSSSEHLTTGPTNTQSLLIASALSRLVAPGNEIRYLQLVFGLTLLKGLIQLALYAGQMGNLVRFVSRSVIIGVAAGAGVLIISGQLPHLLGISLSDQQRHLPGVLGDVARLWPHLSEINGRAVAIGLGVIAIVLAVRAASRLLPGPLLGVLFAAALVALMGWTPAQLPLIGSLPHSLPRPSIPAISLNDAEALFSGALALALLGVLESVAIAKALATHSGERIDPNQEIFAQGIKNFLSSFFQCFPGSASFTRSALDYAAGAQTRFAAVFNSLFVALIYLLFAGQARFIPMASLAGVLMVIALGLIDWRAMIRVARASRADAAVCLATLAATLLLPLQYAIFFGIALSMGLYLRQVSRLHIAEMVPLGTPAGTTFLERPLHDRQGSTRVLFLQVEGDLFFGLADELQDHLTRLLQGPTSVVILRLRRTHSMDSSVMQVLEQFALQLRERGGHVILCGVRPDLIRIMRGYGLLKIIGEENVFEAGLGNFSSAKRALQRARELVGSSIDIRGLDIADDSEHWGYEI